MNQHHKYLYIYIYMCVYIFHSDCPPLYSSIARLLLSSISNLWNMLISRYYESSFSIPGNNFCKTFRGKKVDFEALQWIILSISAE